MEGRADEYLGDVLSRLKMTKTERNRVGRHVFCPNCEAQIDPNYDLVATYSEEEQKSLKRRAQWASKYSNQLKKFHDHLTRFPSLGAFHPMGRHLAQAVRSAPTTTMAPKTWYRARGPIEGRRLRPEDFLPPDPRRIVLPIGRYNHPGQSAYYIADSAKSAAVEKLADVGGELWIAEVILNQALRLLDARTFRLLEDDPSLPLVLAGLVYEGIISRPVGEDDLSYPQYQIPRYVADLVRRRNLDGILYTSSKEYPFRPDVFGTNIVIVRADVAEIVKIGEPQLFQWAQAKDTFLLSEMTLTQIDD